MAEEEPRRFFGNTIVVDVLNIQLESALLELRATGALCSCDLVRPAWSHVRNLFEGMLGILYIKEDPPTRCGQYRDFAVLQLKKSYQAQMDHPFFSRHPDQNYEKQLNDEASRILAAGFFRENSRNWRLKDLRQTAAGLGAEEDYRVFYQFYSQFAHGTAWGNTIPATSGKRLASNMACGYAAAISLARAEILDVSVALYSGLKHFCEDPPNNG